MIKRGYSVSFIKANEGGGAQYRHIAFETRTLFRKSVNELYKDAYRFIDNDKSFVIISLSRL